MTYSADKQPDYEDRLPRGLGKKTLMLAAIEEETGGDEKEFFKKVLRIGLGDKDNPPVPMLLSEAMKRIQPPLKPTGEKIHLDIKSDATHYEKFQAIFEAVTSGSVTVDHGQILISMVKDSITIQESTELLDRLAAIEEAIKSR